MIAPPKSRREAERCTYGDSLLGKAPFNPSRCAFEVIENSRSPRFYQCQRKPGFGPDGIFCRQHEPAAITDRERKSRDKYEKYLKALVAPRLREEKYARALRTIKKSDCRCAKIAAGALDATAPDGGK